MTQLTHFHLADLDRRNILNLIGKLNWYQRKVSAKIMEILLLQTIAKNWCEFHVNLVLFHARSDLHTNSAVCYRDIVCCCSAKNEHQADEL